VIGPNVHQADTPDVLRGRAVAVRARARGENGSHENSAAERRERDKECPDAPTIRKHWHCGGPPLRAARLAIGPRT
jgi:hypothetical protein